MKAKELLQKYAAGQRHFHGVNLSGQSFKGENLSGVDFTAADIRGANFTDDILRDTNFTKARAGKQRRWIVVELFAALVLAMTLGSMLGFSSRFLAYYFEIETINKFTPIPASLVLFIYTILFTSILQFGFTVKIFRGIASAVAIAVVFSFIAANSGAFVGPGGFSGVFVGGFFSSFIFAFTCFCVGDIAFIITIVVYCISVLNGINSAGPKSFLSFTVATVLASLILLLSIYIARCSLQEDGKFNLVRSIAITLLLLLGGTTFQGADLIDAVFVEATLQTTNFANSRQQATLLTRIRWNGAKKLDRSGYGNSILADPKVRTLLVSGNGYGQSFIDVNLHGANLDGANLDGANLTRANLSEATLIGASLKYANLKEAQAINTNFSKAYFTGACIEAWNIDSTTDLEGVDCQYIFLLESLNRMGNRERRPHDPNSCFQPGDFEKFFKVILNEVQILIRGGISPDAFKAAFQKLMAEYSIAPDPIRGIEKKGEDVLLTIQVSEDADKGNIQRTFEETYQARLEAAKAQASLKAEKRRGDDLKEVHLATVKNIGAWLSNLTVIIGENNTMNDHKNQGISAGANSFVNTGEVQTTGSTINLGTISGNVTNAINQLSNKTGSDLKAYLSELQSVIDTSTLPPEDKAEALEQVKTLAEVAQDPEKPEKQSLGKRAIKLLKGTVATFPDIAKFADACAKLLPLIAKALGLPI